MIFLSNYFLLRSKVQIVRGERYRHYLFLVQFSLSGFIRKIIHLKIIIMALWLQVLASFNLLNNYGSHPTYDA